MWQTVAAVFLAVVMHAGSASAQTEIRINADPVPIVDAQINGHAVRLEVDLRMPGGLALSRAAAQRLGVRRSLLGHVGVGIEGASSVRGALAQPRVLVGQHEMRSWTGIFPSAVTSRADGVIGPGALPYDVVTIVFADERADARSIVLPVWESSYWAAVSQVDGEQLLLMFDVVNAPTIFNRTAAVRYDASGAIVSSGALVATNYTLGISTMMQPVTTDMNVAGIALVTTLARTNTPLLGVDEEDAIVVRSNSIASPAGLTIGRDALIRAGCSSIRVDRRARQMTLRCAPI